MRARTLAHLAGLALFGVGAIVALWRPVAVAAAFLGLVVLALAPRAAEEA